MNEILTATPGQTIGPFYGYALPYERDHELVPPAYPKAVRLTGRSMTVTMCRSRMPCSRSGRPTDRASCRSSKARSAGTERCSRDGAGAPSTLVAGTDSLPSNPDPSGRVRHSSFPSPSSPAACLNRLFTRAYVPGDIDALAETRCSPASMKDDARPSSRCASVTAACGSTSIFKARTRRCFLLSRGMRNDLRDPRRRTRTRCPPAAAHVLAGWSRRDSNCSDRPRVQAPGHGHQTGRTLTQYAVPITFGLKLAHWLSGVLDAEDAIGRARESIPVQCRGAAGTLALVAELVPDPVGTAHVFVGELGLVSPGISWHTTRTPVTPVRGALVQAVTRWVCLRLTWLSWAARSGRAPRRNGEGSRFVVHDAAEARPGGRFLSAVVRPRFSGAWRRHRRAAAANPVRRRRRVLLAGLRGTSEGRPPPGP